MVNNIITAPRDLMGFFNFNFLFDSPDIAYASAGKCLVGDAQQYFIIFNSLNDSINMRNSNNLKIASILYAAKYYLKLCTHGNNKLYFINGLSNSFIGLLQNV